VTEATFTALDLSLQEAVNDTRFGFDAMGAVEYDFQCAGMCQKSNIYSFSDTSMGPPPQNCSVAVVNFANSVTSKMAWYCWFWGISLFACGVFMCFMWGQTNNKLTHPLLGHD